MTNSQTANPRLQAALAHARHGRAVLPVYWTRGGRCACRHPDCPSPAKHPIPELVPRGVKQATTSRVVIHAWWAHAPRANPALATGEASGVVVLDVAFASLKVVTADTGLTANEGYTAGSHSMQDSGTAIQNAADRILHELAIGYREKGETERGKKLLEQAQQIFARLQMQAGDKIRETIRNL